MALCASLARLSIDSLQNCDEFDTSPRKVSCLHGHTLEDRKDHIRRREDAAQIQIDVRDHELKSDDSKVNQSYDKLEHLRRFEQCS